MDLDAAARLFNSDALKVERRYGPDGGEHVYLCSTRFDGVENTKDGQLILDYLSARLLSIMNGALRLHCGSLPLKIEDQVAENADGTLGVHIVPASGLVRLGMIATAMPEGGGPSTPEQWALADDPEDDIQDALIHFSRGDNWFDLWKAFEVVQADVRRRCRKCGKSSNVEIVRISGRPKKDIDVFCIVANYHRHEERNDPKKAKKANRVMIDLKQGNKIMAAILRGWITERMRTLP